MNDLSNYWDRKWSQHHNQEPSLFAIKIIKEIKKRGLTSILDIACGNGKDVKYFLKNNLEVTATDIAGECVKQLKKGIPNAKFLQKDTKNLDFKNESFDAVYAHLALHYFDDKDTTDIFNNIYRMLKNNGIFCLSCKSTNDTLYGQGEKMGTDTFLNGHIRHFFSEKYMRTKLEKFKIIDISEISGDYHGFNSTFIQAIVTK